MAGDAPLLLDGFSMKIYCSIGLLLFTQSNNRRYFTR